MNYLKKIISTGAVRKTPKRIIDKIRSEIIFHDNTTIIEVGAGRGEITEALLNRNGNLNYYALEIDPDFYAHLTAVFPQAHILQQDALKFQEASNIPTSYHYFVSSIPLSFYKHQEIEKFCIGTRNRLEKGGKFIILFTAFWLIPTLKKSLPEIRIEPFATFPPYFLAVFEKN